MNLLKMTFFLVLIAGFVSKSNAQDNEVKIKTEFHCEGGKAKIEKEIAALDGVNSVVADMETKIVTITFDPVKQSKDSMIAAIEKTGHKTEFTKPETEVKSSCGSSHKKGDKRKCDDSK